MSTTQETVSKQELVEKAKQQEPSVDVELPSGGHVYPQDSPMANGKLSMRYMKGKDEEILISPTYLRNNETFDVLLSRLIMEPDFNVDDLTIADKEYLIISARLISLGEDFELNDFTCRKCGNEENEVPMKLSDIKEKPILHSPDKEHTNEFTMHLPASDMDVTVKVLTGRDQKEIEESINRNQFAKDGERLTYTIAKSLVKVPNIKDDFGAKVGFVKELPIKDSRAIRNFIGEISGGTDFAIDKKCSNCGKVNEVNIDFGLSFFF